jgi:uncharacterized membrane protein
MRIQKIVLDIGVKLSILLIASGGILSLANIATKGIQYGLGILIFTQFVRLIFVMIGFMLEKDFLWLLMSSFVLLVLLFSWFFHSASGSPV